MNGVLEVFRLFLKIWVLFFLSVFSVSTQARSFTSQIQDIGTWHDGHTVVKFVNGPLNGCAGQHWYSLGRASVDLKAETMLAMALAAHMANRTVTVVTNDGDCQGGEEKIIHLSIGQQ